MHDEFSASPPPAQPPTPATPEAIQPAPSPVGPEHQASANGQPASPLAPPLPAEPSELHRFASWCLGFVLVLASGWGLVGLTVYLCRTWKIDWYVPGTLAAIASLGLFLALERNFWLSRLMGLRYKPGGAPWLSVALFWLLGILSLLFRSPAPQTRAEGAGQRADSSPPDSVREVVETVVFVVVLVLMLKSFVAEAFVIPTGSMAETLYGYQKTVTCPDCGIEFEVNCSSEVDPSDDGRLEPIYACTCPNCRQHIHFANAPPFYLNQFPPPESVKIDDPGWNSGDRVLVSKPVYDLLGRPPDRFDVVVFKYPGDEYFPRTGPYKNGTPMNYIKRCVGKPRETIGIHRGKLFYLPPELSPHWPDYDNAKKDPEEMARLWQQQYMHRDSDQARQLWEAGQFRMLRKPPETILAMMRIVYDNDHPPGKVKGRTKLPERWQCSDAGWQPEGRGFHSEGTAQGPRWARYRHTPNREQPDRRELITDFMGYNTFLTPAKHRGPPGENWVSDLVLECEAVVSAPSGALVLELSKGTDRFRARFDIASGKCTLLRRTGGKDEKLAEQDTSLRGTGTYRLRFANVDDRLTVWVDDRLPFDAGVAYDRRPREPEGPTQENDLEPASIGSDGAAVTVRKLRLFRDTYYTVHPSASDVPGVEFGEPSTWRRLDDMPLLTLYIPEGHYLCLGDNSPESSDGRSWGTVPQRLLLGRAVLVYYPFGRAGRIR